MDFDLHDSTILVGVAGSRAYGLHTDTSDVDLKGVCLPPRPYHLTFRKRFDQCDKPGQMEPFRKYLDAEQMDAAEREKLEGVVYGLGKFMKLTADCNPGMLDVLFCRDEELLMHNWAGQLLREHRDLFLSGAAKHRFTGYAFQQLKRIKGHRAWLLNPPTHKPTREEFGLGEEVVTQHQRNVLLAAIDKQLDEWKWDFGEMADSEKIRAKDNIAETLATIGVTTDDELWIAAARSIGIDEGLLEALKGEKRYKDAQKNWKSFETWKRQRNPKRAALEAASGYDTKHGAHLVRLLRMGREILTTGKVHVWRGGIDREELLAIRKGAWTYDELVDWADRENAALGDIYTSYYGAEKQRVTARVKKGLEPLPKLTPVLPYSPDMDKLDDLYVRIVESVL